MLKSDLVNLLVEKRKVTQKQAEQTVEQIFGVLKEALIRGENVEIRGLGAFHVKSYKGYRGRNPKTSEAIEVRPKRGVLFRTGKELRERVNRWRPPAESEETPPAQATPSTSSTTSTPATTPTDDTESAA